MATNEKRIAKKSTLYYKITFFPIVCLNTWLSTRACYDFFYPSTDNAKNHNGGISNFHTTLFQNSFVLVSWTDSP